MKITVETDSFYFQILNLRSEFETKKSIFTIISATTVVKREKND